MMRGRQAHCTFRYPSAVLAPIPLDQFLLLLAVVGNACCGMAFQVGDEVFGLCNSEREKRYTRGRPPPLCIHGIVVEKRYPRVLLECAQRVSIVLQEGERLLPQGAIPFNYALWSEKELTRKRAGLIERKGRFG